VVLTTSGADAYLWSNGETTQTITIAPPADETFAVTVTYPGNCTASASTLVTVNALPTASITGTTTLCEGDDTELTATGGVNYTWSNGENTESVTVDPTTTTPFSVTVTDQNSCTATATATVTVLPSPDAEIAGPTGICAGELAVLTASGGSSYNWSNGETTASITVDPLATTDYSVTVTNLAGCTDDTDQTLEVFSLPTPIVTESNFVLSVSGSFATYAWYLNGQSIGGANGPNFTATQNGSYTVVVTDANGCSNESDPVNLTNVGMTEISGPAFRVFPNPNAGTFVLECGQPFTGKAQLFDAQGRLVLSVDLLQVRTLPVELSSYGNGTYYLRLVNDQQVLSVPVVIAR
jgi:hypothetical protein